MVGVVRLVEATRAGRGREENARLAVEEERERFARDLHDILGHWLTVITVKAELAARLVASTPSGPGRDRRPRAAVARGARGRAARRSPGFREVTLAGELADAASALAAAGIDADLPGAPTRCPATGASCSAGPSARA